MPNRTAIRGLKRISEVRRHAKETLSEEEYQKIDKSFKTGMTVTIIYFVLLFAVIIGLFVFFGGSDSKTGLATIKDGTVAKCYQDGKYIDVDLADYVDDAEVGDRFMVIYDDHGDISQVQGYDDYRTEQSKNGMITFGGSMVILVGGFAIWAVLYRKCLAKDWIEYTSQENK